MALQSLLLSRDDDVIRVLRRVLNDLEIEVEVCTGPDKAAEELARRKWDAIIIDCDDCHGALDVLRSVRQGTSNKTSTAFAIINGITSVRNAFEMGANLALEKPITADRALHSFRAVHGMMLAERRRYYRHPGRHGGHPALRRQGKTTPAGSAGHRHQPERGRHGGAS